MAKRITLAIIGLILVFGGLLGGKPLYMYYKYSKMGAGAFQMPPAIVSSAEVKQQSWSSVLTSVGSFKAVNGVMVSPETQGLVTNIAFRSGKFVNKGDLLVAMNDDVEEADLDSAKATLSMAKLSYTRNQNLMRKNAVSSAGFDKSHEQYQLAKANVAKIEALIAKKHIRAPFSGKVGIRKVNVGQFVTPGAQLVSLQSLNPLYIQFNLPEQNISQVGVGQKIVAVVDGEPDKVYQGKITAINSEVDVRTRNILIQGEFQNPEFKLYPGMFSDVKVYSPEQHTVITVPETAITYSLHGDSVFVIDAHEKDKEGKALKKVKRQYVTIGETRGGEVAILKGLKAGQEVVTSGQLKLHDGSSIKINNEIHL